MAVQECLSAAGGVGSAERSGTGQGGRTGGGNGREDSHREVLPPQGGAVETAGIASGENPQWWKCGGAVGQVRCPRTPNPP